MMEGLGFLPPLLLLMASPLAWQGDGPPQPLPASLSAHCDEQFDTSHSLASLTFIAAQLSTLLFSIAVASSAAASPASLPHLIVSPAPPTHSPSSTVPPLSDPLALCHSSLTAALSNVLCTSIQLLSIHSQL